MRHQKHKNQLGVKKEHRAALMANLAAALIREGRIQTTLKKAKALRPFAERLVTLAKRGTLADRRLAMSRIRDAEAVQMLFNEQVGEFANRAGGYTRIYKLGIPRRGDAAEMALIEWVKADDVGYRSSRRKAQPKKETAPAVEEAEKEEEKVASAESADEEVETEEVAEAVETEEEQQPETPSAESEAEADSEEKEKE